MQALIEEFGQYLRHERGQSEHTQKAYSNILNRFADWAGTRQLARWNAVKLSHLLSYLDHQRNKETPTSDHAKKKTRTPTQRVSQTQHREPLP